MTFTEAAAVVREALEDSRDYNTGTNPIAEAHFIAALAALDEMEREYEGSVKWVDIYKNQTVEQGKKLTKMHSLRARLADTESKLAEAERVLGLIAGTSGPCCDNPELGCVHEEAAAYLASREKKECQYEFAHTREWCGNENCRRS